VLPNSDTLDHCGPMTWTVADCALVLQAIAGHDAGDPASATEPVPDFSAQLGRDVAGMRVGIVRHFFERDLPAGAQAQAALEEALRVLRDLGLQVREVHLRPLQEYAANKVTIQLPEIFSVYGEDVRRRPAEFGPKLRERIATGDRIAAVDYVRAQRFRRAMTTEMAEAIADVHVLVTCGAYGPAPLLRDVAGEPMRNKPEITVPFSMTGFPAISVCVGKSPYCASRMRTSALRLGAPSVLR
jgi:aspartyl-tRNA(Asn)/glutamyl-tRNA(Gln) amidotransferase subunit A